MIQAFVRLTVCLSRRRARCAKTAERIDVLFEVETPGYPRNIVSDGSPRPPRQREFNAAFAKLLWPLVFFQAALKMSNS